LWHRSPCWQTSSLEHALEGGPQRTSWQRGGTKFALQRDPCGQSRSSTQRPVTLLEAASVGANAGRSACAPTPSREGAGGAGGSTRALPVADAPGAPAATPLPTPPQIKHVEGGALAPVTVTI
jgi:hypothetical protein